MSFWNKIVLKAQIFWKRPSTAYSMTSTIDCGEYKSYNVDYSLMFLRRLGAVFELNLCLEKWSNAIMVLVEFITFDSFKRNLIFVMIMIYLGGTPTVQVVKRVDMIKETTSYDYLCCLLKCVPCLGFRYVSTDVQMPLMLTICDDCVCVNIYVYICICVLGTFLLLE